ncbi:hypothetical protein [Nocardia beijingensis]|uniref:Uncharacterized protein n=1 Tax=Nocardia beijingensis TaxID=95162 RepID=A0ABW7W7B7_9NOCA
MHATTTATVDRITLWPYSTRVAPGGIDHASFGLDRLTFDVFAASFRIDTPEKARALHDAYEWACAYLAPFVVKITIDMAPTLLGALTVNPQARIVFLGRDGFVFGDAFGVLYPRFHAGHCAAMYLSRSLVGNALRELEVYEGRSFDAIESFRKRTVTKGDPGSAWRELTAYFLASGIDIGGQTSEIHVVDTGLKGSIQEMLAAAYPDTTFVGHYAFYCASPDDPHPGSKTGYALHLDDHRANSGNALRGALPDDVELTFQHHEAIVAIEELVQGPHASPTGYGPNGRPITVRHRHDPHRPATDPYLREAVTTMNSIAVIQLAREVARGGTQPPTDDSGRYRDLARRADELRGRIRTMVARQPGT